MRLIFGSELEQEILHTDSFPFKKDNEGYKGIGPFCFKNETRANVTVSRHRYRDIFED